MQDARLSPGLGFADLKGVDQGQAQEALIECAGLLRVPAAVGVVVQIIVGFVQALLQGTIGVVIGLFIGGGILHLMLMMVDPNVHFHVFPRYSGARSACDITLADQGWPAAPKLDQPRDLELAEIDRLRDYLRSLWPQ